MPIKDAKEDNIFAIKLKVIIRDEYGGHKESSKSWSRDLCRLLR